MMSGKRTRGDSFVWEPSPDGWRKVRAKVPRVARAERVPRPPEHRKHRAVDGAAVGYSARELREGARGLLNPSKLRRLLVELEDLAEAGARALLVPTELAAELVNSRGGATIAALVFSAWQLDGRRGARRRRRKAKL
jgi:hypothetical protein